MRLSTYEAIRDAMDGWPEVSASPASAESCEEVAIRLGTSLNLNEQQLKQ